MDSLAVTRGAVRVAPVDIRSRSQLSSVSARNCKALCAPVPRGASMFKKKKSQGTGGVSTLVTGAAGGDSKKTKSQKRHDVALALKGQDKEAVRAAAKEASDAAVKEGKKKMGCAMPSPPLSRTGISVSRRAHA